MKNNIILIAAVILFVGFAYAHPSLPTEFYGRIVSHNLNATSGTVAVYVNGNYCGSFRIVNSGFYGVLSCFGKDTDNPNSPGGFNGDHVTFTYNSNPVSAFGDTTFTSGEFKFVNITHPVVFCGDNFCDALENCGSCPQDCMACNATGNLTNNQTSNFTGNGSTGGGGGGSGGSSGGGSGAGGAGGGGAGGVAGGNVGSQTGGGPTTGPQGGTVCFENWQCTNWTDCTILGVQSRSCYDVNGCNTYYSKPVEAKECTYVGNCFDGLISCHDGKCEEGIDCGGPCAKKCPILERPFQNITITLPKFEIPQQVCEKHIDIKDKAFWIFVLIITLAIIIRLIYSSGAIKRLKDNEKIQPLDRAKKILSIRRRTLIFIVTLIILAIASMLYSYYFLLCPNIFFDYSWLLIFVLILVPLIIHALLRKFEFSESEKYSKEKTLEDTHYQNIIRMIDLENEILSEEENNIANKLYELSTKPEFSKFIESQQKLKEIYKNLVELYTKYKEKKNPFELEKDFCDEIKALDKDVSFKVQLSLYPELQSIFDRLNGLYSQYEEKQKLYEQLDHLEEKAQEAKK